jgi:hypothetical protein
MKEAETMNKDPKASVSASGMPKIRGAGGVMNRQLYNELR